MKKLILILIILTRTALAFENDSQFLEMVAKRTFHYFWDEANPQNGLIPDATKNRNCSISVVGFGLASICIADSMGWITHKQAYDRVLLTLKNFVNGKVQHEHGHHYHWVDINTGKWIGEEGIFATDTAAFIAGVLTVAQYFAGTEIENLADKIYKNVDWTWFFNKENNKFYVGWTPSGGFGGEYDKTEIGTFILLMAIASPTYPIPVEAWFNLGNSYFYAEYKDYKYVGDGAAYTHQWPFCFIDPRLKKDYFLDYFQNLREFSLASRQWCIDNKQDGYNENSWGLNPSVGPDKYGEYAAPVIPGAILPYNGRDNDGTVAPTAAISFTPFTPEESIAMAKYLYNNYKDKVFGNYGFYDSYNLKKNWFCNEYLGIDQGPIVIMIDNYLSGTVWKNFTSNKYIKKGMEKIGFVGIIDNFDNSKHSSPYAKWVAQNGYKFLKENKLKKEGENSLTIEFNKKSKDTSFYIEPQLKDFSDYKYLSFWKTGNDNIQIWLVTDKNKKIKLNKISETKDDRWSLLYYNIPKTKKVKRIIFNIDSRKGKVNLDFIHLTSRLIDKTPPAVKNFVAQTGEYSGEIDLFWETKKPDEGSGNIASYRIKMSERPIKTKADFEKAKLIKHQLPISYNRQKFTISGLVPGKKYYFAIATENNIYNTSEISTADGIANSQMQTSFSLGKNIFSGWSSFSSEGDEVQFYEKHNRVEIKYNFIKHGSWHWAGIAKQIEEGRLPHKYQFRFKAKGEGVKVNIEFKLIDKTGSVFGKKIEDFKFDGKYYTLVINSEDITYWWGGQGNKSISIVQRIEIAFSTDKTGAGGIIIKELEMSSE